MSSRFCLIPVEDSKGNMVGQTLFRHSDEEVVELATDFLTLGWYRPETPRPFKEYTKLHGEDFLLGNEERDISPEEAAMIMFSAQKEAC